jgi:septal ring factor EnvC (AmiA/AmiB activator)
MKGGFLPYKIVILILVLSCSCLAQAQSKKQVRLEERRKEILVEIRQINTLLAVSKQKKNSLLSQVEELNLKIRATKNLIKITNDQANLLTREIKTNNQKLKTLEDELVVLKDEYAHLVVQSYKSKKQDSKLMFILSSANFLQAYKRMQYLKQFTAYRKKQGDSIIAKTARLKTINKSLDRQKTDKEKLVAANKKTQKLLLEEKKEQEQLVAKVKNEQQKFTVQIRKKQQERNRIDKQIDQLIREAIVRSKNKTKSAATSSGFALTKEAKALGNNFKSNKGKLPWPVVKGVKTKGYGKRRHPTLANVTTFNSGVEISTAKGAVARAAFNGTVLSIQALRGANKAVFVQHGSFITVYNNIGEVYVKKGDILGTKDPIGKIVTNAITGKTILKFLIYQDTNRLNPEEWLFNM